MTGIEPATLGTTIRCSNQLSYNRHNAPGGTRTPNPLSRNQLRYPITPQEQVGTAGVEPATPDLSGQCSNHLSYAPMSTTQS